MKKEINNILSNGLVTDTHLEVSDNTSYRYASNLIHEDLSQNSFLTNEHSTNLVHNFSTNIVGTLYIPKLDFTIVFLQDESIHKLDHKTNKVEFIAKSSEFKCSWGFSKCENIDLHYYEDYPCDAWIMFSASSIYYNINLSELLDPKRKQNLIEQLSTQCGSGCNQKTCDYFKVFKTACDPILESLVVSGGNLKNGTYFISGRYYNNQSGFSNPFPISKALHIGSYNNQAGEISNKRIQINISNYTCAFDQIQIFVQELVGGIRTTKQLNPRYIDGQTLSIDYTGNEGVKIDADELLINARVAPEGEDLVVHNNKALYYRLKPDVELNFQGVANQIDTSWYAIQVPLTDIKRYNMTSFMRGETYAFSFSPNYKNGKKGFGFHIPAVKGSNCHSKEATKEPDILKEGLNLDLQTGLNNSLFQDLQIERAGSTPGPTEGSLSTAQGLLTLRLREKLDSTLNNPTEEEFIKFTEPIIASWLSDIDDVCKNIEAGCGDIFGNALNPDGSVNCDCGDAIDAMCEAERRKQQAALCRKDSQKSEQVAATWFGVLADYIEEDKKASTGYNKNTDPNKMEGSGNANILTNPSTSLAKLKQAATALINAVKKKENIYTVYKPFTFTKSGSYGSSSTTPSLTSSLKEVAVEVEPGLFKKYPIIKKGKTIPKVEKNKYPCTKDCKGNYIYCDLQGKFVTHHTFPSNQEVPFYVPKSYGDGGTIGTDADIMDGYGVLLGVAFDNVNIDPAHKQLLCNTNPYNFGMVIRNNQNSTVILKGPASQMYISSNQGKQYLYEKAGSNSFERCSRFIDINGSRMDPGATTNTDNIALYSIDQLVTKPYLNASILKKEGAFKYVGARHYLYRQGSKPINNKEEREDQRGSVHTMNVTTFTPSNQDSNIRSQIYAEANAVISPDAGNNIPLMNKYGQEFAWITANRASRSINDDSFVGDVYQHTAPITDAEMEYFGAYRKLDNQYGDISSLNYTTILQAKNYRATFGLVGDSFIGVHTIIKTNYISEKVGNYFPIGNMVPGKADRCLCDTPDDALFAKVGNWYWKELPKEGDAADAKNWIGLHTTTTTKTWAQSKAANRTESDTYFPKVAKFAISYVGESNTNPWLREKTDLLSEQVYDNLHSEYDKYATNSGQGLWDKGYLNQFYQEHNQPAQLKIALKVLIESTITIVLPLLGINEVLDASTAIEAGGNFAANVINIAVYIAVSQMLFTNDYVEKLLRLDPCKKDSDGGENTRLLKYFTNYNSYNTDYLNIYAFPNIIGLPNSYTGCDCNSKTINTIYVSDENFIESYVNSYQIVRPKNLINLDESKGLLTRVYELNDKLYLHTTNGIFATKIDTGNIENLRDLLLGNMAPFKPQFITSTVQEGSHKLLHPNHGKLTKYGFAFIDYTSKKYYLFTGNDFEELSSPKYGNSKLFNSILNYCSSIGCPDEFYQDKNFFSIGVDNQYNRLLLTKSDGDYSFTISFDFNRNKFISFHSYIPSRYLSSPYTLYSVNDNSLHIHNNYDKFSNYYDEQYNVILDVTATHNDFDFKYLSTNLYTESVFKKKREFKNTFDKVYLLNSFQTSGELSLTINDHVNNIANDNHYKNKDHYKQIITTLNGSKYTFNEVFDYIIDGIDIPLEYEDCKVEPIVHNDTTYLKTSQSSYENRILFDNYLYYRFIYNTFDKKLYIKRIKTLIQIDNESDT